MRISSKSMLSPGRPQISLSTSLSRKLRTNGSVKGSPMFPNSAKKRGSGFENPEPSSPKVTCIGQVRVKAIKNRTFRSKTRKVSFRKLDSGNLELPDSQFDRNQRWVHFPVTICEALRGLGAEFSCFLPCKSLCMASEREDGNKVNGSDGGVERWLAAAAAETELVVGEDERFEDNVRRRHVFEGLDIESFVKECNFTEEIRGDDNRDNGMLIPPKNALLLMRCRSDPVKVAALANKVWESPALPEDEEEEFEGEKRNLKTKATSEEVEEEPRKVDIFMEVKEFVENSYSCENSIEEGHTENVEGVHEEFSAATMEDGFCPEVTESIAVEDDGFAAVEVKESDEVVDNGHFEEEIEVDVFVDLVENSGNLESELENEFNAFLVDLVENSENLESELENEFNGDVALGEQRELELGFDVGGLRSSSLVSIEAEDESDQVRVDGCELENEQVLDETLEEAVAETEERNENSEEEVEISEPEIHCNSVNDGSKLNVERTKSTELPDCLLLMMREPKLSTEVSKETRVCSGGNIHVQPGRSSCSFPVAPRPSKAATNNASMFVLPRCKSEPRRSAPETCFWKNKKLLQPHCPAAGLV
ncbi:uncharacterized protein [Rutidosis leptorrhynchoides]|uniref:uncharacterized protein n=1 Tax=Rutidosis leptorrhynchoides TaxID=125765 RepID=UPI003A98CF3E